MRLVVGTLLVVLLCACGERHGTGTLMETKQGVFYVSLLGDVFLFTDGRFILTERVGDPRTSSKVIKVSQQFGGMGLKLRGRVKIQRSIAYVQFDIEPVKEGDAKGGTGKPNSGDIEVSIDELAKGNSRLTAITLDILDTDGFKVASTSFELPGSGWTRIVDERGKATALRQQSQFSLNPQAEWVAESAEVGWRTP